MSREQRREALQVLEKDQLIEIILDLQDQFGGLRQRVVRVEDQIAKRDEAPPFVKPNRPQKERKPRKKRAQGAARRRETPTRVERHALSECPDCGHALQGGWLHCSRQIIDIPMAPAEVVEHQFFRRHCGVCGRNHLPHTDLGDHALGTRRFGLGVMSLVTHLDTVCRLPVRQIQSLLGKLYQLRISCGEIAELLHATAKRGARLYEQIRDQVRKAHSVNVDETGWRENGLNGYVWSFSTDRERFFTIDRSRSGSVAANVLGEEFQGVLGSDFYSGYNYYAGEHQRCWAHLLRDLKDLGKAYEQDESVTKWIEAVQKIYQEAAKFARSQKEEEARWEQSTVHPVTKKAHLARLREERVIKRKAYANQLHALALPWIDIDVPQRVLAQRIERHLPELLAFVEHQDVDATNNLAERSIRPCVIRRKVSGGTRTPHGSKTRSVLMTLFDTWTVRGENTLAACRNMLAKQHNLEPAMA